MRSLKDIKRRIVAARGTQKITHAMKLVSAAKLKAAQLKAYEGRAYVESLAEVVARISKRLGADAPALWRRPVELNCLDALVITTDRGFCGSFNENLLRWVYNGIVLHETHNIGVNLIVIGKKGSQYFKAKGINFTRVSDMEGIDKAIAEASHIMEKRFTSGESSGGVVCFNKFVSASKFQPTVRDLLPLYARSEEPERQIEYKFEPTKECALEYFAKRILEMTIRQAMLESKASELAARIMAMTSASKNASDMIMHLTGLYNKARQENITLELLDVVGGANAQS